MGCHLRTGPARFPQRGSVAVVAVRIAPEAGPARRPSRTARRAPSSCRSQRADPAWLANREATLRSNAAEQQARVVATEAERIAERVVDPQVAGRVGHVVEIAVGIG